jgi:tripartite-type tricarboxylate transporter receptor subunit TctC
MSTPFKIRIIAAASLLMIAGMVQPSWATDYPDKPMKLVVPFAPGGNIDTTARNVASGLAQELGQPVIVENRAGAGGLIGSQYVARAAPDGYTFLLASTGALATAKALNPKLDLDPVKDFVSAGAITRVPFVLVENNEVPAKTLAQLIAYAKANPGKLTVGSDGSGTASHLSAELFQAMSGTRFIHVPYKGSSQALTDLMGGQISLRFDQLSSALPLIKTGKIRALGVTTLERSAVAPDLPTLAESGLPKFEASTSTGILFPAGTPQAVIARFNAALVKTLQRPEVRKNLLSLGADVTPGPPQEFARTMRDELAKWTTLVQQAHIKIE